MAEGSAIGWTGNTFNPWLGCVEEGPECAKCYARDATPTRVLRSKGLEVWGRRKPRHLTSASYWLKPLAWQRACEREGRRLLVFCGSLCDVFEQYDGPLEGGRPGYETMDEARQRLYELVEKTPLLTYQFLSKRSYNAHRMVPPRWLHAASCAVFSEVDPRHPGPRPTCTCYDHLRESWPGGSWPANVAVGTTAGTQRGAARRIPPLLRLPAPVLFVSVEPALEVVNLRSVTYDLGEEGPGAERRRVDALTGRRHRALPSVFPLRGSWEPAGTGNRLGWVIWGGESGIDAPRSADLQWAQHVRADCEDTRVPFFMKQAGAAPVWTRFGSAETEPYPVSDGKGAVLEELPPPLQVRQFPSLMWANPHPGPQQPLLFGGES